MNPVEYLIVRLSLRLVFFSEPSLTASLQHFFKVGFGVLNMRLEIFVSLCHLLTALVGLTHQEVDVEVVLTSAELVPLLL